MQKKILGIIGGMGPMATVDLFSKIVRLTKANIDSDHIHIVIDNYPQIPDRTKSIKLGDNSPVKYLIESAKRLEKAGVDFIVIPCNTSHYYLDDIQNNIKIPIINMIEETAKELSRDCIKQVGILATDGVIQTHLYEKYLKRYNIQAVIPDKITQKQIMSVIYDEVKSGNTIHPEKLFHWLENMYEQGVEAFILGCTELPIAFKDIKSFVLYDPTEILAKSAIQYAGYSLNKEVIK